MRLDTTGGEWHQAAKLGNFTQQCTEKVHDTGPGWMLRFGCVCVGEGKWPKELKVLREVWEVIGNAVQSV